MGRYIMNIRSVFRENLLLEVFEPGQEIYYKSIIQGVHEDYIAIGIPLCKQEQLYMAENSTWDFRLYLKDTLYYFSSPFLEYHEGERVPLYLIGWPDEVHKVQRREFFRFPCVFDAHYWILKRPWVEKEKMPQVHSEPQAEDEHKDIIKSAIPKKNSLALEEMAASMGEPVEAMITNISGGGLLLVAPEWMPIGTVLLMRLFLKSKKKEKTLFVKGKVVWIAPSQPERTVRFRHAIEYDDVSERIKDEIVGFIFVLMRERML